ncbi:MAP kinase-interacting serine/threonine-protein kinase 1-like [Tubulanus polymorphus]|uniref:MAP kinase-interacting serine/threonine-protein kinase 1-like n=1 Tax=Tubulanus polymorphus TaxID=672921 RepID=UPI003DA3E9F8
MRNTEYLLQQSTTSAPFFVPTTKQDQTKDKMYSDSDSASAMSISLSPPRPESLFCDEEVEAVFDDIHHNNNNNNTCNNDILKQVNRPRRKRKKRASEVIKTFNDLYEFTGEILGEGATSSVLTYKLRDINNQKEYAVKVIEKTSGRSRIKVFKEVEIFNHCQGQLNILQLHEFFEEEERFYLVFDKMEGGTLLANISQRGSLTEQEASKVVKDIATALNFLHERGMAHRDLKPENILCQNRDTLFPVKICDFDLGSEMKMKSAHTSPVTTPELLTPVGSAEYMAPEVVDAWVNDSTSYDKKCDLWSLGIILYIMLCGYPPFYGTCGTDCGWEKGKACESCQESLFTRIQEGVYYFPDNEWELVSEEAKDLIRHLLVRNPLQRYSAVDVLRHPWVKRDAPTTLLATPKLLMRNNSTKDLEAFAGDAIAVNRMVLQHLTINEPASIIRFHVSSEEVRDRLNKVNLRTTSEFDDDNDDNIRATSTHNNAISVPFSLSSPNSKLARRRNLRNSTSESLLSSSPSPPSMFFGGYMSQEKCAH